MRYPALIVDREKLRENTSKLAKECHDRGIKVAAVSKVYCGMPEIASVQAEAGVDWLADSRLENLVKLRDIPIPKILLRLPMISQARETVELSDMSLVSEVDTCRALSEAAVAMKKEHQVLLMVDVGDLREGVWPDRAVDTAREIASMPGLILKGIGTNLSCYGAVLPSPENLGQLASIADSIESECGIHLDVVSGGNSSSIRMLLSGGMPERINMLRLGESMTIGKETADCTVIPGLHSDVFTFAAEVIELKTKPSIPIGKKGLDAFGHEPVFEDRGLRKRAIVAVGQQDMRIDAISPRDEKTDILGASSDHMILDVTDGERDLKIGDVIEFDLSYGGVLAASTSSYVTKVLL
ncbi:alanine/ornithine racemase family PLP-dependent enzyme [Dethiosulfovibrio sp. F2B]|uniref:alanine/ornithine racemase family PLP-dependent enzyme n=1 Tax=Dethiosulfovibrio faecalis TaxID=2720018 RepID=UPI001F255A48|nr:alanine/ornithine racemase family PLP-dependent enzyme [Dethiosulfovibrio faecalis]MCF4150914.1 alanine/ornithine racemase family PLP-dependent enzyme [Dethiosulfovibrio faecalis]